MNPLATMMTLSRIRARAASPSRSALLGGNRRGPGLRTRSLPAHHRTPRPNLLPRLACVASILASVGCKSLVAVESAPAPRAPETIPIFSATGERAALDAVVDAISDADIVVLGELHGHPTGLGLHAELFRRTLERSSQRSSGPALCLEFLTRETQHLIDAYLASLIDWPALEKAYEGIPGSRPGPHRPMIEAAREAGAPVVAANAPRIYTRAARERGYDKLTTLTLAQRRLFDVPEEMPEGGYRERFFELMSPEGDEPASAAEAASTTARLESAFRAQCLWDMTMASSVSSVLDRGHRPALLVVGSFHCNDDGGTVQMLRRLRPHARILVVTFVDEEAEQLLEKHRGFADYVAYVGQAPSSGS